MQRLGIVTPVISCGLVCALTAVAHAAPAKPRFEFPAVKKGVTVASTKAVLETISATKLTCESSKGHGEILANGVRQIRKLEITFEKCASSGVRCSSEGAPAGTIDTKPLAGTLGYLKEVGGKEVGIWLQPEEGEAIAPKITCLIAGIELTGRVIGEITPINKAEEKFELPFKQTIGEQEFGSIFLEEPFEASEYKVFKGVLKVNGEQSGLGATYKITTAEKVTIVA